MELAVSIFSFPNRRRTFKNQNVECTWQFLFLSETLNETSDLLRPSSLIVSSESWYIHVDSEKGGLRWMCLCVVWARKEMVNEWLVTVLFQSFPHGRRVCVFQFLHQKTLSTGTCPCVSKHPDDSASVPHSLISFHPRVLADITSCRCF